MVRMSWKQLNEIAGVIQKLANDPKVDQVASYRAARVFAIGHREVGKITEAQNTLFKKFHKVDEKGEPVLDDKKQPIWASAESAQQCHDELEKMMTDTTVEIKINKFEYAHLSKCLTGAELMAIEEFVNGIPEIA